MTLCDERLSFGLLCLLHLEIGSLFGGAPWACGEAVIIVADVLVTVAVAGK